MRVAGMLPLLSHFSGCRRDYWSQSQLCLWAKAGWVAGSSQGPYWWQRPPHMVPTGAPGAVLGFSILLKDTSTCIQVRPITSRPGLPTALQPPLTLLWFIYFIPYLCRTSVINDKITQPSHNLSLLCVPYLEERHGCAVFDHAVLNLGLLGDVIGRVHGRVHPLHGEKSC